MGCFGKSLFRWGLVGGLVVGGLAAVSPGFRHTLGTGVAQIKHTAQNVVNSCIDDPVALRHQLAKLAEEYPNRIGEVKKEMAQVETQLAAIRDDADIAERVVANTTVDLQELRAKVEQAQNANSRTVSIRHDGVRYNMRQALNEAENIRGIRETYQDRYAANMQQVEFLEQQQTRLSEILTQLEDEYEKYKGQLWQLDNQIDAIERNDRLIEMTKRQQEKLDSYSRFSKVGNLSQVESKLAELRTIQEAQLQQLAGRGSFRDYEKQARFELESGVEISFDVFDEIDMEDDSSDSEDDEESDIAWAGH